MVVLDIKLIASYGLSRQNSYLGAGDSKNLKTDSEEDVSPEIKAATHLYLQDKNVTKISSSMSKLKNLKVLYLYDNKIKCLKNLHYATNLTNVYLQNNQITSTLGLSKCQKLEKLYLGCNSIQVVEDLVKSPFDSNLEPCLKELNLESQNLPKGMEMVFDPECLKNLGNCLKVLNVCNNNMSSFDEIFQHLGSTLTKFNGTNNNIKTLNLPNKPLILQEIKLLGNPIIKKLGVKKYRQQLVVKFKILQLLDLDEISSFERKWHESFYTREQKCIKQTEKQSPILESKMSEKIDSPAQSKHDFKRQDSFSKSEFEKQDFGDFIPPVPEHWRHKGLPGGRIQFDKILEKAKVNAHYRLLNNNSDKHSPTNKPSKEHFQKVDFNLRPQEVGDVVNSNVKEIGENVIMGEKLETGEKIKVRKERKSNINLANMKLAPLEPFNH